MVDRTNQVVSGSAGEPESTNNEQQKPMSNKNESDARDETAKSIPASPIAKEQPKTPPTKPPSSLKFRLGKSMKDTVLPKK